jgi:hypothetical protein
VINTKYAYGSEKLAAARRGLMAPHPAGEATSYAGAFHECMLGLKDMRDEDLDDSARRWISTIRRISDTAGVDDPTGRGTIHHCPQPREP